MTTHKKLSLVRKWEYMCYAHIFCPGMTRKNWHQILSYTTGLGPSFCHSVQPLFILSEGLIHAA